MKIARIGGTEWKWMKKSDQIVGPNGAIVKFFQGGTQEVTKCWWKSWTIMVQNGFLIGVADHPRGDKGMKSL